MLLWALLWSQLVDEIVFLFVTEDIETSLKVLLNEIGRDLHLLFELFVFILFGLVAELSEGPETSVAEEGTNIDPDGFQEVLVVEAEHAMDEILKVDTKHPDLLIVEESARHMVESILSEGSAEIILHLQNASVVHINHILFIFIN